MMGRLGKKNIHKAAFWGLVAAVVLARLLVAWCQRVYLSTDSAPLDDMLMIRAAISMGEGNWLGEYGAFTMAKSMGYAVWLWLLHTLHLPVLLAQAALWVAASAFATRALRPLLPGNLMRVCVFAFLCFNPVSYAFFNQRVYRDAIFPAFCLLLFAGAVGLGLRLKQKRLTGSVGMALGMGAGLAGGWLLREDGLVLLLFAFCALAAVALFALVGRGVAKRAGKAALCAVPLAVLVAATMAFSAVNNARYGYFGVNDLNSGSFPQAYANMVGVSRAVSGESGVTPVTTQALGQLYAEVPSLAELQEHLESGPAFNGFADMETGEFGGSFYYALRLAAQYAGKTPDAAAAQEYWQTVSYEIQMAVGQGRLQSAGGGSSVVPRFSASLLGPTLRETVYGTGALLTMQDCDPRPRESTGVEEDIQRISAWLNAPVQSGYEAGTANPYYNPLQKMVFAGLDVLTPAYALLVWGLLVAAVWRMLRGFAVGFGALRAKKGFTMPLLLSVLALGLLCSLAARLVVAAYMEVSAFQIGTYIMYLSSAAPALLLLCALGVALPLPQRSRKAKPARLAPLNAARDLRFGWLVALGLALVAVKLVLAGSQHIYLSLQEAVIDDALAVNQAMSITAGSWLGEYGWLTLSKHSFFSLWLAVVHALRIPYLTAGQLLWAGAAFATAWAAMPLLKKRWLGLCLFGFMLFNPASTANPAPYGYITRVYRDNIFPALCVLCVAGMVGYALRWRAGPRKSLGWLLVAGVGFAAAWLTREDGWWLLPFVVLAAVVCIVFHLGGQGSVGKRLVRCTALLIPFVVLGASLLGWAGMNYKYYGRFILSDFSSGEFADAYGAMTRIEHESWNEKVAVPYDVRRQLYDNVAEMAELEPVLEGEDFMNRYAGGGEFSSGSYYWALREAAWQLGYYDTPQAAQQFWQSVATKINALCDSGVFTAGRARSSVNPPIRSEYILPVLVDGLDSLVYCATFQYCYPESLLSINDVERNAPAEAYLNETALVATVEGGTEPYYNGFEKLSYNVLNTLRGGYAIVVPLGLLAALVCQVGGAVRLVKRARAKQKDSAETMLWFVGLGLMGCILLRVFMIGYVTISSFTIGVYVMYLATVHPLMLLYAFMGTVALVRWAAQRRGGTPEEETEQNGAWEQHYRLYVSEMPEAAEGRDAPGKPGQTPKRRSRAAQPAPKLPRAGGQGAGAADGQPGDAEKRPGETAPRQKRKTTKDGRYVYKPGGNS